MSKSWKPPGFHSPPSFIRLCARLEMFYEFLICWDLRGYEKTVENGKKKGWKREKLGYQIVNFMWNWNIFMAFQVDKSTLSGNRIFLTTYEFHYPASFNPFWCCHWITVGSGLHSSRKRSLLLQSNLPYSGIIFYCAIYNVSSTSTSCCAGVLCYRISLYFITWKMWKLNTCCAWLMDENFLFAL